MMNTTTVASTTDVSSSSASKEKQVFDLSLMKEKSQPLRRALFSTKPADCSSAANPSASAPSLDDSSISTVGSNASGLYEFSTTRRSLFSKYWVNTGESPSSKPPTAIIEIADDQLSQEESQNSNNNNNDHDHVVDPVSPMMVPRRSLFSHHNNNERRRSNSLSCLDEVGENHHNIDSSESSTTSSLISSNLSSPVRYHKSEGELISSKKMKQPVSCLRESRFSISKRESSSGSSTISRESSSQLMRKSSSSICSESSVVQFDMESTEVRHFLKPAEVHAEDGWTNYFY